MGGASVLGDEKTCFWLDERTDGDIVLDWLVYREAGGEIVHCGLVCLIINLWSFFWVSILLDLIVFWLGKIEASQESWHIDELILHVRGKLHSIGSLVEIRRVVKITVDFQSDSLRSNWQNFKIFILTIFNWDNFIDIVLLIDKPD